MAKTKQKTVKSGLTKRELVGYGLGDLGGCMTFAVIGTYFTRYCTNVLHADTTILGIMLLVWNIWDAVNDPLMGMLMDRLYSKNHNKKGKFRPWLLRSAPLVCVTFIVLWTVPTLFSGIGTLVALFFCKILYEASYTMFNIPMGSLLSAMSKDDGERASLSSARGFGSGIGNMLPLLLFPMILKTIGETAKGYALGAAVCAVLGFVFCILHYFWTSEKYVTDEPSTEKNQVKFTDVFTIFRKNRLFLALCIHGVCICTMQYVSSTLGTYMYADVLGGIGLMTYSTLVTSVCMVVVLIACPMIAKKLGMVPMIRASLLTSCVLYLSLFVVLAVTNIPPLLYMVWSGLAMGIAGMSIYMQWGMVAEATDYNEVVTSKRSEGTIYGTFNLARRIGQTLGNSAAVWALGWIGYDGVLAEAGGVQSAGTIFGIKVLCVLIPGIFVVGSWIAFKFLWKVTPEMKAQMAALKEAGPADQPE